MASVSGATSSLGNTSLRGFGGLASGIDRDSIIEQMSLATNTKIQNQKDAITKLTWKQEAYRSISDKILGLQDDYLSYASSNNLQDPGLYAKDIITALGDSDVTKYISASGASDMLDYISVRGVERLATSANVRSAAKGAGAITTKINFDTKIKESRLPGKSLIFGSYKTDGSFQEAGTFTFPSSYKNEDGEEVGINYLSELGNGSDGGLIDQLNKAVKATDFSLDDNTTIKFSKVGGKINISYVDKETGNAVNGEKYLVRNNSNALEALGFDMSIPEDGFKTQSLGTKGYKLSTINGNLGDSDYRQYANMAEYLKGRSFTVTYGGQSKEVELITAEDAADLAKETAKGTKDLDIDKLFAEKIQKNLDRAFGSGKISVTVDESSNNELRGNISFNSKDGSIALSVTSSDNAVREETGLNEVSSTKINVKGSILENREKLGFTNEVLGLGDNPDRTKVEEALNKALENFEINGVKIEGINSSTSVSKMMSLINSSEAGVKATYLSSSNKFTLIATETGSGRDIQVGNAKYNSGEGKWETVGASEEVDAAAMIFVGYEVDDNKVKTYENAESDGGQDAVMYVNYGAGNSEKIISSTNTFNIDGFKITASGVFGSYETATDGSGHRILKEEDVSQAVTFTAKADVDDVTEKVKKFVEDYNALVKLVNSEVTTRPDSDYGPLTDDQKAEMSEEEIERWEAKAKSGMLFNNGTMRDLSMDIQSVMAQMMRSGNGISYEDLEDIGISASEDWTDGGVLVFDESKFRSAMESEPEKVSRIFTGTDGVKKGLTSIVNDTLKTYATRYRHLNKGSYGRLIEEAGSEKLTLSIQDNQIYKQLKEMNEALATLRTRLKTEQDQYIHQFTVMEQAINNMNSQSSYLSSLGG